MIVNRVICNQQHRILKEKIWNVKQIVLAMKMANALGLQIMKLVKARLNKINILRRRIEQPYQR